MVYFGSEKAIMGSTTDIDEALAIREELNMKLKQRIKWFEAKKCYRAYYAGKHFYAKTEEDLLKVLRNYEPDTEKTVKEVWIAALAESKALEKTKKRYRQIWKQFLTSIENCSLKTCTVAYMEEYLWNLTAEHKLTKSNFRNAKTELNRAFRYAEKKGYIDTDPMRELLKQKKQYHFKQTNKKLASEMIFTKPEVPKLKNWCNSQFEETGDAIYLAPIFVLNVGTRVGEVCALDFTDYDPAYKEIRISKMYTEDENGIYSFKDHTKDFEIRVVPVFKEGLDVLKKLPYSDGLIFRRPDGSPCTTDDINNVLEAYARFAGGPVRRSHSLRRTFASCLDYHKVSREKIREYLGHSDLSTTAGYIYSFDPTEDLPDSLYD